MMNLLLHKMRYIILFKKIHDIRHLLATTLVQNGTPIQYISRMLGHSKIAITEARYATTNKEQANKAMNDFNKLMEL